MAGFDTIRFDSALTGGTIRLSSALEVVRDQVALSGLLFSGGKASPLMHRDHPVAHNSQIGTIDPLTAIDLAQQVSDVSSANGDSGILATDRRRNRITNKRIGTSSDGISALGNDADGVTLINADNNSLRGTRRNEKPFIYYNVVSGNGLRVRDSNNTIIHANFLALGSDKSTVVTNGGDETLTEGTSLNTQYGGVIPQGNVNAGNKGNDIAVTVHARGFISFNTFAGLTTFGGIAPNQKGGIAIPTDGGTTRIRTNVISGNLKNGLHITVNGNGMLINDESNNIVTSNTTNNNKLYRFELMNTQNSRIARNKDSNNESGLYG